MLVDVQMRGNPEDPISLDGLRMVPRPRTIDREYNGCRRAGRRELPC